MVLRMQVAQLKDKHNGTTGLQDTVMQGYHACLELP
jgi:hypothetical protein